MKPCICKYQYYNGVKINNSTLREKISEEYVYTIEPLLDSKEINESFDKIVKIADDFAIDFADWLNNGRFSQYGNSWVNPKKTKDKDGDWIFFSSKELLEIYKKEKGL